MRLCKFSTPQGGTLLVNPMHLVCAGLANDEKHHDARFVQVGQDGPETESSVALVKETLDEIAAEFESAMSPPLDGCGFTVVATTPARFE